MSAVVDRIRELGYTLPEAPQALASYLPTRLVPLGEGRALLFVSGQISRADGELLTGRVPDEVSVEAAVEAARSCALGVLAQIEAAVGLDKVEQIAQVTGFVNCTNDFRDQPTVINGASDLFIEILGDAGRHSRAAVGSSGLPRGVTAEVAATILVRP